MIAYNKRDVINILHANRQFLAHEHLSYLEYFISSLKVLKYEHGENIPTLGAHLKACQAFTDAGLGIASSYGDTDFCRIIERVPDRVDEVAELLKRGCRTPQKVAKALRSMPLGSHPTPLMEGAL
jgi:hypothetical protein